MIGRGSAVDGGRIIRASAAACAVAAGLSVALGAAGGHPMAGVAVGAGLLIGSLNGTLARRSLGTGMDFRHASLGRLAVLSAAGLGVGALLGAGHIPAVVGGIAAAQLLLAAAAGLGAWEARR